jgi:beta-galactosidase
MQINVIGDIYMEMKEWGKGYVWVNGYNLGRFWHIGPATRLYVPGTLLKVGNNEVIVLDLESS